MNMTPPTIGAQLKTWRQRRRMSQLDLSLEAEISTRHLSFMETGRSRPSRDMVLHLAEQLDVPLRDQNQLLLAAGYAPQFPERDLDDPALEAARRAVDVVLAGHEPYPALAVDRHWSLVAANRMVALFLEGVPSYMQEPPLNVIRVSLHPEGMASRIVNYRQWRVHIIDRLRQQVEVSADPVLDALLNEVNAYPFPEAEEDPQADEDLGGVAIPFRVRTDEGILSAYTTTTVFGTPVDITLQELAIESFFPADAQTAEFLRRYASTIDEVHADYSDLHKG